MMNNQIIVKKPTSVVVKAKSFKIFQIVFLVTILLITYFPIIVMAFTSFSADPLGYRMTSFTTKWYSTMANNADLTSAILFTIEISILSTVISTIFGTLSAIGINALSKKAKSRFILLNNVPVINSDIVSAVFLLLLFQVISIICGVNLISKYSFITTLLAHIFFSTPFVVLSVLPKLSNDNSLYDAAIDLGCTPFMALIKVVIPNIKSGIASGAMLAFTMSIDDFIITHFVSGSQNNFSTWLYGNLKTLRNGQWNQACAFNTILILVTFSIIVIYQLISNRKKGEKNEKNI